MAFNTLMHDRNIYKTRPDFTQLAEEFPEIRKFSLPNNKGKVHIDFTSPDALRTVTKILLKKDFDLSVEIPDGFLIPTVPQRLNYILWIEDLLNSLPLKSDIISGIDIGTGPCAVFSLLGSRKNGWQFISTETSEQAIECAVKNIRNNNLESKITVRKVSKDTILKEVLSTNNHTYDFCLCNPPFFGSIDEIRRKHPHVKETIATTSKEDEILFEGGEVAFVKRMIQDSLIFKNRISLYSTMFGKKKSYLEILRELENMNDITYTKTEFCQGNTVRWGIAWTFLKEVNFQEIKKPKPKKPKKAKPPLIFEIPFKNKTCTMGNASQQIQGILHELEIQSHVQKSYPNYVQIQLSANKNTWSHQRRRRRRMLKKDSVKSTSPVGDAISSSDLKLMDEDVQNDFPQSITERKTISEQLLTYKRPALNDHQDLSAQCRNDIAEIKDYIDSTKCQGNDTKALEKSELKSTVSKESYAMKPEFLSSVDLTKSTDALPEIILASKILDSQATDTGEGENVHTVYNDITQSVSLKRKNEGNDIKECKKIKGSNFTDESQNDPADMSTSDLLKCKNEDSDVEGCKKIKTSNFTDDLQSDPPDTSTPKNDESSILVCNEQRHTQQGNIQFPENTDFNTINIDYKSKHLLNCEIKLRKCKKHILFEINCPPDANRDSMYQIFQLFKNKLNS